jgi:hypothetical protein
MTFAHLVAETPSADTAGARDSRAHRSFRVLGTTPLPSTILMCLPSDDDGAPRVRKVKTLYFSTPSPHRLTRSSAHLPLPEEPPRSAALAITDWPLQRKKADTFR